MKKILLKDNTMLLTNIISENPFSLNCDCYHNNKIYNQTILKKDIVSVNETVPNANNNYVLNNISTTKQLSHIGSYEVFTIDKPILQNTNATSTTSLPVFPPLKESYAYTGLPSKIHVAKKIGALLDFIPIDIYSTCSSTQSFIVPLRNSYLGCLDQNNNFCKSFSWKGFFEKNQHLFSLLLDSSDTVCKKCNLICNSYWSLCHEFKLLNTPKSISLDTLSFGLNTTELNSILKRIGIKKLVSLRHIDETTLIDMLTTHLQKSFNSKTVINSIDKVIINPVINNSIDSTTIPCLYSIYQYHETYSIMISDELIAKLNSINSDEYFSTFATARISSNIFDYKTKYFAKVKTLVSNL